MSSRKNKKKILQLLAETDAGQIQSRLAAMDIKDVVHALFSGICSSNESVHWNAVVCMGTTVDRLARQNTEDARIIMRRLLWSLNDESGGIGWGAPEAMAEIMVCNQKLAEEYLHMLISYMREDGDEPFQDGNYLEHELLQRGLLWGISRLAAEKPHLLLQQNTIKDLLPYLQSADPMVRGLAARSLGLLGAEDALNQLQKLKDDKEDVRFYESGQVVTERVNDLASQAIDKIQTKETC